VAAQEWKKFQPEVPKFFFCSNNGGHELANESEKPHVQRVKSKFDLQVPKFDLAVAVSSVAI
jgi:hypothetical protein